MAEEDPDTMNRDNPEPATEGENICLWTKLPRELQHKVLSYLPLRNLFQVRCVCKDWRYVIHRRGFRSLYDGRYASECPSPAICYAGSYYPSSLEWSIYDYVDKVWKKMRSFPPQTRVEHSLVDQSIYSVEGLLCLLLWKQEQNIRTHFPWLVWNPLTNKWKNLPTCKHKTVNRGTFFVHAYADVSSKTYKILMAHNPKQHPYQYMESDTRLVTEIYDSATGTWTESPEYKLQLPLSSSFNQAPKRGMLCNGMVYFVTSTSNENILLSYDIKNDQWHEETTDEEERMEIFEWDGHVMTALPLLVDDFFIEENGYRILLFERNPDTKRWEDTGIEIPYKIRNKFFEDEEGVEIVASGNHLAITGYTRDGSFRIAVYKKAEKYWRFPPTASFSDKMRQARVEGLFQFKPRLDWIP
ncbi:putative F-box protein At3g16210 [Physcomitrium patens]|uniref:F-box domain-containing protein n=1 Tax=Physcomitrium patens TaxID=3218 RepID=A0A2K1JL87_PHYPA|nr:F-box only protein 6-like [Physcomitrium patens]XP_024392733.1 F-box only protein 6-like [Physcomitrium patens]XP_024392734.1 F-box only protein 6-like [Physcomitrium patens]XP_024392735.1 F-box only protein 6-like [Physcomitrium patens]XP_024392736.1 F-box only protein 6-like [Physcomitrium patens]XP_024392738.1 F-box only protein 6-like [Physcomitrium patens]XP_024392739.1 F-box only protein 6-like [Physcomitrium patens]PNR42328.1 hypothetical protein PHYPA_017157 [Physcomitrium patens]|eukprot:XP_024392732.1 F-box only protein 6-like [Physcomitrella patens]